MPFRDILAGASFGALVGCLFGFSAQSAVSGGIAAVIALAAGFVGVVRPAALVAPSTDNDQQGVRVASFGVSATVFYLVSYVLALNHALEPSLVSIKADLIKAGYSENDARTLIGIKYFGVFPEGWKKYTP